MPAEPKGTATSPVELKIHSEAKTQQDAWDQLQDFALWLLEGGPKVVALYGADTGRDVSGITLQRN